MCLWKLSPERPYPAERLCPEKLIYWWKYLFYSIPLRNSNPCLYICVWLKLWENLSLRRRIGDDAKLMECGKEKGLHLWILFLRDLVFNLYIFEVLTLYRVFLKLMDALRVGFFKVLLVTTCFQEPKKGKLQNK